MKKCSFCGEKIQDIAKKCRYCGEWFKEDAISNTSEETTRDEKSKKAPINKFSFGKTFLYSTIILVIILLLVLFSFADMLEDNISEIFAVIFGGVVIVVPIGLVITFFIKWLKEGSEENNQQNNSDAADIAEVKKQWSNFIKLFWLFFFIKLISKGTETIQDQDMAMIMFVLQFPAILGMVILMGYYSYKFSGKKLYWLFGLLGLLWFAVIGIFLGFFQVQRLKNIKLGMEDKCKSFKLTK